MKIFISSDIEGTTGIATWDETELNSQTGAYFRAQMSREVAAACRGALAGGASEILVKDAHDSARNIDPSQLPQQACILRSWTRDPFSMMAGISADYYGAFYTGYHSGAGWDSNPLAHTMNTKNNSVIINGILASELYINMLTAAYVGVPSLLVTGDAGLCAWAEEFLPGIQTVAVSRGIGGASASIHPDLAVSRIETAAAKALEADPKRLMPDIPDKFNVSINYRDQQLAYRAASYPGVTRVDPKTVEFSTNNWYEVIRTLFWVL